MKTDFRKCEQPDSRLIPRPAAGKPGHILFFILALIIVLSIPMPSFAQDFTATTIGDYGNITVMEVAGNYDAKNPDDSMNDAPRQDIAKEFFRTHKDEYDFLVIFTNFNFQMLFDDTEAFYSQVQNDIQGIGLEVFDNSDLYGSSGKLQGTIDMGNISNLITNSLDTDFENTLDTLGHEVLHRWSAFVKFKEADDSISSALIGKHDSHWNFLLDTDGSLLYGNDWQDNGDGTFTSVASRKYYSPLDMYLMGFHESSEVPPMLLIENPAMDPARDSEVGVTINGTPRYITIEDIIAAEGERVPGPSGPQKIFKTAYILATASGTFTGQEIYGLENIRNGWITRFSILTDGYGIMQVASSQKDDLPTNPGVLPPSVDPRELPPDINEGVTWLMNNQQANGSWMDLPQTVVRDTAVTIDTLESFDAAQQNYTDGLQWLGAQSYGNIDYMSRKIEAVTRSGGDAVPLLDELVSKQNPDGGWGSNNNYRSNSLDTSFVLNAFATAGYAENSVVSNAIEYLKSKQNPDGGWGVTDTKSIIQATANALSAFQNYSVSYQLDERINSGTSWLLSKQNPDGGFGNSPSTVYDSSVAALILRELDASMDVTNNAVNYILDLQSENGSWYDSPYQTALAVSAVWKSTIDPDLSIRSTDVTFIPADIETIPVSVAISADIWNTGRTDVPSAIVKLYDGEVSEENKVDEQEFAFAGQSYVTVTFSDTITAPASHTYHIVVDPDNLVNESNESNNSVVKQLPLQSTYDFEILDSDVSVSSNQIDAFQDVTISTRVTNRGTMDAYNVYLYYFIDEAEGPFNIATVAVDIPANSSINHELVWRANKAGENLSLTVTADPNNGFHELSEDNNTGVTTITVNELSDANLTIKYDDITITPDPAAELGSANISAVIRNEGFSEATGINVSFFNGVPGVDGVLLGTQPIPSINAGESSTVSFDWTNIPDAGEKLIYVQVDPDNTVTEIREDDNEAFVSMNILSLPDLAIASNSIAFIPAAPREGDEVAITVTVQNGGAQSVSGVTVTAYEDDALIGTQVISQIEAYSQAATLITYDTTGKSGVHRISVIVDPDNLIAEQSESNNAAIKSFGVQDSSFWLTEPYISPNGDGVRDETQIFYRLETAQDVIIDIVNRQGETVRSFSGGELDGSVGGMVTWGGENERGVIVDDGQYQIQLLNSAGNILGTLAVIVDNNRSPLSEALGTEYLLNNNLTCELPEIQSFDWEWFTDESGILFNINDRWSLNTTEYTTGLYTMAPDGDNILRLVPLEWSEDVDPVYDYSFKRYESSPDNGKIAFILAKIDRSQSRTERSELWVVDSDGSNLTMLESFDVETENSYVNDLRWSPDSSYIAYRVNHEAVWIIRPDGTGKLNVANTSGPLWKGISWSPDNQKIAYVFTAYDEIGNWTGSEVWVSDISGNSQIVYSSTNDLSFYEISSNSDTGLNIDDRPVWLNNQGLFLKEEINSGTSLWIIDTSGNGDHLKVSDSTYGFVSDPDRMTFVMIEHDGDRLSIVRSDGDGDRHVLYESEGIDDFNSISDLRLSQDGSQMAFVDRAYEKLSDCNFNGYLVVIDLTTEQNKTLKVSDSENLCYYMASYHISTMEDETWVERATLHYDLRYKTKEQDLARYFKNTDTSYSIRISQQGLDAAHLDYIALSINGEHYAPVSALKLSTGEDVLQQVAFKDNNVADMHLATVDFVWEGLPAGGGRVTLVMNAREEDLARRKAFPFRYPAAGYYIVELQHDSTITVDGAITPEDTLSKSLFKKYSRPVTGHPEGYTYGYVESDGEYIYGVIDFTSDNTVDNGKDWASMEINTSDGVKTYLVNDSQEEYGKTSFTYTDKVNYQHKVYEFKIPLIEIGLDENEIVNVAFNAYGTAGSGGDYIYFVSESLRWLSYSDALLAGDNNGIYTVNAETMEKTYLPIEGSESDVSPLGRYITYYQNVDQESACYGRGNRDLWAMSSLLNLTADVRASKENNAVYLKGIAADLDFASYLLEYADINVSDVWHFVAPPFNRPVVDDTLAVWVPPYEGNFYVRLTVRDRAGNETQDIIRISWGISSSITNIYKNYDIYSPNGDGIKDIFELHYRVMEPIHLEFTISDENGNLIRTIQKDHIAQVDDLITWDGRDAEGYLVPDGIYKVKVFTYEFFVEVDNTLPLISISPTYGPWKAVVVGDHAICGYANDENIKHWTIEYGEGANPAEWINLVEGDGYLGLYDSYGEPIEQPQYCKPVKTYAGENVEWIINKKFRLTAEDYAGNIIVHVSGFLSEEIEIFKWDGSSEIDIEPGVHDIDIIETIREKVDTVTLYYGTQDEEGAEVLWHEQVILDDPPSGVFSMTWDNSDIQEKISHIKLLAVDRSGNEYEHEKYVEPRIKIDIECPVLDLLIIENEIALQTLSLQIMKKNEPGWEEWTDITVYDTTAGDIIPMEKFKDADFLPEAYRRIGTGKVFIIRAVGLGLDGEIYESTEIGSGGKCAKAGLDVQYFAGEECGGTLYKARIRFGFQDVDMSVLRQLTYRMTGPSGYSETLADIDLTKKSPRIDDINADEYDEGIYTINAALRYEELHGMETVGASEPFIVDRTHPDAQITYPGGAAKICPIKYVGSEGEWYGINVEGIADDANGVKTYSLYYGFGANPLEWYSAIMHRNANKEPVSIGRSVNGLLGLWDVTDLTESQYSLKLEVIDTVGNKTCYYTTVNIDKVIDIIDLRSSVQLFSPNDDGSYDDVQVTFSVDEDANVDVDVYELVINTEGRYELGSHVRSIASGLALTGDGSVAWDGKDEAGIVMPDGRYGISVYATDSCGNSNLKWIAVEVDNTPPALNISYPGTSDPLGNIVEVTGTVEDIHITRYSLEYGQGTDPVDWIYISYINGSASDDVLGTWNTSFLDAGPWTIRLSAEDLAGNTVLTMVTIDLSQRKDLITALSADPTLFSPNNDGLLENTLINYEVTDACDISIEMLNDSGIIVDSYTTATLSGGLYAYTWNGSEDIDGEYTVNLTATLTSNTSVTQTETVTIDIDTTPPLIDIVKPEADSYIQSNVTVQGSVLDDNILEYTVSYTGDSGTEVINSANQSRQDYTFGILNDLAEGIYSLNVTAKDLGENSTQTNIAFTIDRTAPEVTLETPKTGEYYGADKDTVTVTGSIDEKNLEFYSVRYSAGTEPTQWTDLLTEDSLPTGAELFAWNVGVNDVIPDGVYTLSLYAKDKAGFEKEVRARIIVDNTVPEALLSLPAEGNYVKEATNIEGTAFDENLDNYKVEFSAGSCADAYKWAAITSNTDTVQGGVLFSWQVLPTDGNYCMRLTVVDKSGNEAEAKTGFQVDTHPPAAVVLSGAIEDGSAVSLHWTTGTEPDLAGYNIYRDGQKLNTDLLTVNNYLDLDLSEGDYVYTVRVVDFAGWESGPSNEITLTIDLTGPSGRISSPKDSSAVSGLVDIKGTAYSDNDFKEYRVYTGEGPDPLVWDLIRTSPLSVTYGVLAQWSTIGLEDGIYSIKLEAEDINGNVNTYRIAVTIDNDPPDTPVLISAIATGPDVDVQWQANTETDLAGYLLYRNDRLVNVSGLVVGDLKPYQIITTSYLDESLPDGQFRYYLVAMDEAGNVSGQSNTIEVDIDTHDPQAVIIDPLDGSGFEDTMLVLAETPDLDIDSVRFQYKAVQDSLWIDLGSAVSSQPYATNLDPESLGLIYGDYDLRAIATDDGGRTDGTPASITATYADLTVPAIPLDLVSLTVGSTVDLNWTANSDADLAGYNLYRTGDSGEGTVREKVNTVILTGISYQDAGLPDGEYIYDVTAVDTFGNESGPSNTVTANVYAPVIAQPYTPTAQSVIEISGNNAGEENTVEVFVDSGTGPVSQGTVNSTIDGDFVFSAALLAGENSITVIASDAIGNTSRESDAVVVLYNEPPSAPTGLITSVNGYDVNLVWNANSEPDLEGYYVYRDGQKLNTQVPLTEGSATASSYYIYQSSNAFDGDLSTYWRSDFSYGTFDAEWLQINLPSSELISGLTIHWGSESSGGGEGGGATLFAGVDYEVQVWSGYAWITHAVVTGNYSEVNFIEFSQAYRTDKVRIYITNTTDFNYSKHVRIAEVELLRDGPVTATTYDDLNVSDGMHAYTVTAVDYYGFESVPSDESEAGVGDIAPPSAPQGLAALSAGSDLTLDWNANTEPDLAGYNLYRNDPEGWTKINTLLINSLTYIDQGLENGTYVYRLTAVDNAGNESQPSDEASATVYIAPLDPPVILSVTSPAEGSALNMVWEHSGTSAEGFNLYRSYEEGGPYEKINSSLLQDLSYNDEGLINGMTYYYVVAALDSSWNESGYSNEMFGMPEDSVPPSIPDIFLSQECQVVFEGLTDITGRAEGGVSIELYRNGEYIDRTGPMDDDTVQTSTFEFYIDSASVSSDTKKLAYIQNNSLWIMDIASGDLTAYANEVYDPIWSPDGGNVAYTFYTSNWSSRIGIYNLESGTGAPITPPSEDYFNEYDPSWSSDGSKLAFRSNIDGSYDIWLRDVTEGITTRVTSGLNAYVPVISPDGQKIAYLIGSTLNVVDISSGVTTQVTDRAVNDYQYYAWSPDSISIAYISNQNGPYDVYVYNLDQQSGRRITIDGMVESMLTWSPDGSRIAYERREFNWTRSVVTNNVQTMDSRVVYQSSSSLNYLNWAESGNIAVIHQDTLAIVELAGQYSFSDVELEPGENIFYVLAVDQAGNARSSEEVCIIFDTSMLPDPSIASEDIFIYPTYPVDGEGTSLIANVWNHRQVDAENVDVDIYVWNAAGSLELVYAGTIPYISSQSAAQVGTLWDSTGQTGINEVIVVVDPADSIVELRETNNIAEREITVVSEEGVLMASLLDSDEYTSGQDVNVSIKLINSGIGMDVEVEVRIEDADGYKVAALDTFYAYMSYGSEQNYTSVWETGSTYAGSYMLHTVLRSNQVVIEEDFVPFILLPDAGIEMEVVTDKAEYDIGEGVAVSYNVMNNGTNYVVPELMLKLRITDVNGIEQMTFDRSVNNLLPGVNSAFDVTWDSVNNGPGDYTAEVEAYIEDQLVSGGSVLFGLNGAVKIIGDITTVPAVVSLGSEFRADYSVQNTGSVDVSGLILKVLVIDPESQTVIDTDEIVTDLMIDDVQNRQTVFSTQGYELGTYTLKLQYIYEGATRSMAVTSLTVRDGTPPDVSILSPDNGSEYSFGVNIAALVTDNASGVERVEYRLDDGLWRLLPVSDVSNGKYATEWVPSELPDEGAHSVVIRAFDRAGNMSETIASQFTVEFLPPVADAGADQNVVTGEFVTLDGSGSYDPEGEMLSLLWTFTEVPAGSSVSDASLSDTISAKPTFTTDIDGTYVLELIVDDGKKQGSDTVSIVASTPNVPPNSDAGADQNGSTGSTVNLDGSGSNDPDNGPQPLTYIWRFQVLPQGSMLSDDDITERYNVTAGFVPDVDGDYIIELEVSDGEFSSVDDVKIISLTPNVPPNADAGDDITISLGDTALLDGSASYDVDNGPQPISYSWRFIVLPGASVLSNNDIVDDDTASPSFLPDAAGTYVLELMVQDGLDAGFDNSAVTVIAAPSISVSPTSIDFGDTDLGTTSGVSTVTVTNDAQATLIITGLSMSGVNANEFNSTSGCETIIPGSSCYINVVFSPLSLGARNGLLNISSNDPNAPTTVVPLSGNGVDITSPEISAVADRDTLWPPNHKMVDITIEVYTTDNSESSVTLSAEIQSNEPVNGGGDGNTSPDWTEPVIDQNTGTINLQLRSERSGSGSGRIYTITVIAMDMSGNSSSTDVLVTVPHSKGK